MVLHACCYCTQHLLKLYYVYHMHRACSALLSRKHVREMMTLINIKLDFQPTYHFCSANALVALSSQDKCI